MSFLQELKSMTMIRGLKTLLCVLAFTAVGCQGGLVGTSLLDLQLLASGTFNQAALIVMSRSIGFAFGSVLSGFVAPFANPMLTMSLMAAASAVCHFIMPILRDMIVLIVVEGISGLANGLNDTSEYSILNMITTRFLYFHSTACNVFLLKLWGKESPPFLQILFFGYGFGELIGPLILRPFLVPLADEPLNSTTIETATTTTILPQLNFTESYNETMDLTPIHMPTPDDVRLIYPYYAVAVATSLIAIGYIVIYYKSPITEDHWSRQPKPAVTQPSNTNELKVPKLQHQLSIRSTSSSLKGTLGKRSRVAIQFLRSPSVDSSILEVEIATKALETLEEEDSGKDVNMTSVIHETIEEESYGSTDSGIHEKGSSSNSSNGGSHQASNGVFEVCSVPDPSTKVESSEELGKKKRILIIILMSAFAFVYCGVEVTFGTYIPAYAVKSRLKMTKGEGASLCSLYWGAYTGCRAFAVLLTSLIGSRNLFASSIVVSLVASIILVCAMNNSVLFWAGTAVMGIGYSSLWGSLYGFLEGHFPVTGPVVTSITVFACIGCSVFPSIIGTLLEANADILIYFTLVFVAFMLIIYIIIELVLKFVKNF